MEPTRAALRRPRSPRGPPHRLSSCTSAGHPSCLAPSGTARHAAPGKPLAPDLFARSPATRAPAAVCTGANHRAAGVGAACSSDALGCWANAGEARACSRVRPPALWAPNTALGGARLSGESCRGPPLSSVPPRLALGGAAPRLAPADPGTRAEGALGAARAVLANADPCGPLAAPPRWPQVIPPVSSVPPRLPRPASPPFRLGRLRSVGLSAFAAPAVLPRHLLVPAVSPHATHSVRWPVLPALPG